MYLQSIVLPVNWVLAMDDPRREAARGNTFTPVVGCGPNHTRAKM